MHSSSSGGAGLPLKSVILLIEDNEELAYALRTFLEHEGYAVRTAFRIRDIKEITKKENRIDLVLLDVELPDGDGHEVLPTFQALEEPPAVIVMSAHSEETDRVKSFQAGANDFIAKPFSFHELAERVKTRIQERSARGGKFFLGEATLNLEPPPVRWTPS